MSGAMEGAALITGGAKRIGAAIVRAVAATGRVVVIHYRTASVEAGALAAEIAAGGGVAHIIDADLADPHAAAGLIARAEALAGPVAVLVNNASHFVFDSAASVTADGIAAHMAPNLTAPVLLAREFAARCRERDGVIVNILDQKLANLNPDFFAYTLSKAALAAATEMLAMALAPRIRVCGVAPGLTMIGPKQSAARFAQGRATTPLRRGSEPEDIARAVRFILETPSVTGTTLLVDAGEHLMRRQRDVSFSGA
ncbi:SDR family oxidoreductase [Acidiphilium sp. AL]|uniref:SDR family oxidoreductase n=1 Tax=Acidiphilium iwatense TaxID=768198 RepID=A0ABS9DS77_9PROT|nr:MULTISPECIES: SDR family oxidoreductase [Acidiphilium]MCF3945585.1 SDR family oxidoreductase [Acidiphilium iwatense]MCU4159609.1 SDR family oxidoreductase [Acidiphilium sp. AL]